ncbi:MAG: hypothetical protein HN948_04085 [Clostridia bacterium]|jgi:shikimate dehydrogenase|nr:hypothetical protein [Clostridia bacterium]MBT7122174.1 hypothetical protein [Clostridia bacterium]
MVDYKTYGLLGEKISKSISPQIYNALFQELKIPAVYMPFAVSREKFITALPILREHFAGFTVAAPYRLDIVAHLDQLDESVRRVGAANTVKVSGGKTIGYNTDMEAFGRSLIGFAGNLFDKDVLLIGAGGAAYAAANVLLEKGAFLTIVSRNAANAMTLQSSLQKRYNKNRIKVIKGLSHSDEFFAVFNMAAVDIESKQSEITIHAHTYRNMKYAYEVSCFDTVFLKKADDFGAKTKNGYDMLFYHAIGALKIWQGETKGLDVAAITKLYNNVKEGISW